MNYFDSDVLINSFVNQNPVKHVNSLNRIAASISDNSFAISWLTVQEVAFVLGKLKQEDSFIRSKLNYLMDSAPLEYRTPQFQRAIELAKLVGYTNFNDCLHTAIAEVHCSNFYTYNRSDFVNIQPHTTLNIHILD